MNKYKILKEANKRKPKVCKHFWWPKDTYRPTFTTATITDSVYCMHCLKTKEI